MRIRSMSDFFGSKTEINKSKIVPALAGFQKESLRRKSVHVTDNNNK